MYLNAFISHTLSKQEITEKGRMGREGIKSLYYLQTIKQRIIWHMVLNGTQMRFLFWGPDCLHKPCSRAAAGLQNCSAHPESQRDSIPNSLPLPPTSKTLKIVFWNYLELRLLIVGELLSCFDEQLEQANSSFLASELSLTYIRCRAY